MNFASRVESANKQFQSRVLISDEVHEEIKDSLVIKDFMRTNLPGIEGRVTLHEVEDIKFSTTQSKQDEFIEASLSKAIETFTSP